MAAGTGLTSRQKQFLEVVLHEPYLLKNFYLSGGTALSSWYLHHRESYDLDFFSEKFEVNQKLLNVFLQKNKKKLGYKKIVHTEQLGFNFYDLEYSDGDKLKVDFSYYPSERAEKGMIWRGLQIDSLYDITLNKFQTISGVSPRGKDYVDLYFISKVGELDIERIYRDSAIKFEIRSDKIQVAKQFLKVVEFTDWPKIIIPFDRNDMNTFFTKLAKDLEKDIFK